MSDDNWWVEIVFLAMLAGFIALRLVSVLGRRTGHENPAGDAFVGNRTEVARPAAAVRDARSPAHVELPAGTDPALQSPLEAIAEVDPYFEPIRFVEGATGAYRMILEAFWKGDEAAFAGLVSDDLAQQFKQAIADREAAGHVLENRLVRIDKVGIETAQLSGSMAEVTLRFDADLIAVTRDRDGNVISGSLSDAAPTHDVWTFSRHVGSKDPNWLLIETDDVV
jgi:predicted lipid-binding transport protein (Tim44 family)